MDTVIHSCTLTGELCISLPYRELRGNKQCFGQIAVICVCVCPTSHSSTVPKITVCTAWRQRICVCCVLSFAWNPQSLLVRTSLSVTGGCTAVGSLHKATSNNRGVWLCWHEGSRLMKWNCLVWADFNQPNSPLLLFLVSLRLSG